MPKLTHREYSPIRVHVIRWSELTAFEPSATDVERAADALAAAYNDPRNATLLGHTALLTRDDVIAHYASLVPPHGRGFLLHADGALAGDGDLRGITGRQAEFAFLIAAPSSQGKGLGTRFAAMIHAFAFTTLALDRIYATVIPANAASLRVFEKLGYARDDSADVDIGDPGDVVLRIDRETFLARHATALRDIEISRA